MGSGREKKGEVRGRKGRKGRRGRGP